MSEMRKLYIRYVPHDAVDNSRGFLVSYDVPDDVFIVMWRDVHLFNIEGFYITESDVHSSVTIAIDTYGDVPIHKSHWFNKVLRRFNYD
jgi:hypothetical protein